MPHFWKKEAGKGNDIYEYVQLAKQYVECTTSSPFIHLQIWGQSLV